MNDTYPGGKGAVFRWLINHIPPHDTYIATHLGHDAILRFKRPARSNIGIDADASVIDWWARWDPTAGDIDAADEPRPKGTRPPTTPRLASTAQDDDEGLHHQAPRYLPAHTVNHNDIARAQRRVPPGQPHTEMAMLDTPLSTPTLTSGYAITHRSQAMNLSTATRPISLSPASNTARSTTTNTPSPSMSICYPCSKPYPARS